MCFKVLCIVLLMMEEIDHIPSSGSGTIQDTNDELTTIPDYALPSFLIYLSLEFKLITTMIILLMAGLVLATIKTTRRLNKPHNIFVANLMVTDIILAVISLFQQSVMMVGFITGKGDFIPCNVFHFLLSPAVEMYFTLFLISADKIIAIVYPLRYKQIMMPRVGVYAITASWVLAFTIFIPRLFNNDGYNKVWCLLNYQKLVSAGKNSLPGDTSPYELSTSIGY